MAMVPSLQQNIESAKRDIAQHELSRARTSVQSLEQFEKQEKELILRLQKAERVLRRVNKTLEILQNENSPEADSVNKNVDRLGSRHTNLLEDISYRVSMGKGTRLPAQSEAITLL
ncbi:hypothetical protein BGX26_000302 [Mortierella sp. AD094]|nr:hypothetical protein BGX26_000302 [Mortierella sp. AD094]